ncbi:MAG: GGDEF domain-containing protein [Gammaproteobacteria bacterium]
MGEHDTVGEESGSDDRVLICPVGFDQCALLEELGFLRRRNAELREQVLTDELTGLFNYRYLRMSLAQEMERSVRTGAPVSLVVMDLDHFKRVNDTWGHEVGNLVLVRVAELIRASIRTVDIACRFGGEEFILILPNTHIEHAVQVAERLRTRLASESLSTELGDLEFTASFGVDMYSADDDVTGEQFVARADGFLYEAKRSGRNRVCARAPGEPVQVSSEERDLLLDR